MQGGIAMNQVLLELFRLKKRTLIVASVMLVLNAVIYASVAGYLEPKIASSQVSWNDLRQRVAAAGKADVATVYRQGTEDLKKLATRIPSKRQFPRVLGDILDAGAANAVIIGNVSYKPQLLKDHDLLAYGISMSVGGSYAAIKSFLADLQKSDELVVVEAVSLSKSDLYEENVVLDVHLTVYLQGKEGT
jgi:Tfp pilus assembly protein PilO